MADEVWRRQPGHRGRRAREDAGWHNRAVADPRDRHPARSRTARLPPRHRRREPGRTAARCRAPDDARHDELDRVDREIRRQDRAVNRRHDRAYDGRSRRAVRDPCTPRRRRPGPGARRQLCDRGHRHGTARIRPAGPRRPRRRSAAGRRVGRRRRARDRGAPSGGAFGRTPGTTRAAGREDARGVPVQPGRAVVHRADRRTVSDLQHGLDLGDRATRGDRHAARSRRKPSDGAGAVSRRGIRHCPDRYRDRDHVWAASCCRSSATDVDDGERALHRNGVGDAAARREARAAGARDRVAPRTDCRRRARARSCGRPANRRAAWRRPSRDPVQAARVVHRRARSLARARVVACNARPCQRAAPVRLCLGSRDRIRRRLARPGRALRGVQTD